MMPLFCRQTDLFLSLPAQTINKTGLQLFGLNGSTDCFCSFVRVVVLKYKVSQKM